MIKNIVSARLVLGLALLLAPFAAGPFMHKPEPSVPVIRFGAYSHSGPQTPGAPVPCPECK